MEEKKFISEEKFSSSMSSFSGMYKERNKNIFLTLFYTGMKVSELCNLDIHDIVDESWNIKSIIKVKTDKKIREIPLSQGAKKVLKYFLPENKDEKGPLIISNKYEAITPRQIQRIFKDVSRHIGFIVMPNYCRYSFTKKQLEDKK